LLLLAVTEIWGAEVTLPLHRSGHTLMLGTVYLNGQGPFRMMIDTGNASSLIRPQVARKLGALPGYTVDQVTAAGTRRVPVVTIDELTVGNVTDRKVEAMVGEPQMDGVDGVLGQSWLVRHDYLLDYRNHRLVLDGTAPEGAVRTELRSVDGRPAVPAKVDGAPVDLVVDSGADVLVLFQRQAVTSNATFVTNSQTAGVELGSARVMVAGGREEKMQAARVHSDLHGGLLPTQEFREVYVSNRQGFVGVVK